MESRDRVLALTSWHHDWSGIRVAVLGLGVTGFSVADTLCELGCQVTVIYSAADPTRTQLLGVIGATALEIEDTEAQLEALKTVDPELVIVSPGYALEHPLVAWANEADRVVWGDVQLAWRLRDKTARVADWITVTGTNGKTTTAQLTAHMLHAGGLRTAPVGNIGVPVLDAVRDPEGFDVLVVELSSFQLARLGEISPYSSVCLNFADDHLDWHGSREQYWQAKAHVYSNTQVACVYNRADEATEQMVLVAEVVEGARAISFGLDTPGLSGFGIVDGILCDRAFLDDRQNTALELTTIEELAERGLDAPHVVQNILAAAALARSRGVSPEAVSEALQSFELDAHRAQLVAHVDGIAWIDDSKATNAHAASASLRAHTNVVWIVGGLLKGTDIDALVQETASRLAAAVVIGTERESILTALQRHAPQIPALEVVPGETESIMQAAVALAASVAVQGDTVLLSPAAASMDQFNDYADRGEQFITAVRAHLGGEADGDSASAD